MSKPKPKIVVHVDGGNVQDVYTNIQDAQIVVVDFDNLTDGEGFNNDEAEQILDTAREGLDCYPTEEPDKTLTYECNGEKCGAKVYPEDPYYATPCGTFCSDCMHDHAKECEICASEFEIEPDEEDEEGPTREDSLRDEGRSFGMGESYAERNR